MKNRKAFFIFALIVITAVCVLCACNQKQQNNDEIDFRVTPAEGGKSLMITRYTGKKQGIDIPAQLYRLPVTHIAEEAFRGGSLISVTIPGTVTVIGDRAFANNQLINIVIGNGVTTIGNGAFQGNNLTAVNIPGSVTTIGESAFQENEIVSVNIPNSVTTIGNSAFQNNKIKTVTIPANVSSIGYAPFIYCSELKTINVSTSNKNYSSADGVLYNKDLTELIQWPAGKTEVNIPNTVKTIARSAFNGNQLETSLIIPDSVTEIGIRAFSNNKLTDLTLGSGVTSIGDFAFQNNQLTNVTIPDNVTAIGARAFIDNTITSVTIGANLSIENNTPFGYYFEYYYRNTGKREGTYTRPNVNSYDWAKKN